MSGTVDGRTMHPPPTRPASAPPAFTTPALPRPALEWPRLGLFAFGTALALLAHQLPMPHGTVLALALGGIAVAVWHGAFDGVLAEGLFAPRYPGRWRVPFFATYLALAGVVLLLWWWQPVLALAAFLLYSALHFGTESEQQPTLAHLLPGTAAGLVPIAAACHWWPGTVEPIFRTMLRGAAAPAAEVTGFAGHLLWPAVLIAVLFPAAALFQSPAAAPARHHSIGDAGRSLQSTLPPLLLLSLELLLFRVCSPLPAFALFFCLWHTPEHVTMASLGEIPGKPHHGPAIATGRFSPQRLWHNLRRGLWPWLLSLAAMAIAAWQGERSAVAYAGVLSIGLSALTVPHMGLGLLHQYMPETASKLKNPGRQLRERTVQG